MASVFHHIDTVRLEPCISSKYGISYHQIAAKVVAFQTIQGAHHAVIVVPIF